MENAIIEGVVKTFRKLPDRTNDIVKSTLSVDEHEAREIACDSVFEGFNVLSIPMQLKVLNRITSDEDNRMRQFGIYILLKNFDSYPKNAREELLTKFSSDSDGDVLSGAAIILVMRFPEIGEYAKKKLNDFMLRESNKSNIKVRTLELIILHRYNVSDEVFRNCCEILEKQENNIKKEIINFCARHSDVIMKEVLSRVFECLSKGDMERYIEEIKESYSISSF